MIYDLGYTLKALTNGATVDDVAALIQDVEWDDSKRHTLNRPTGHWLYDPYVINPMWKGSILEDLLSAIPFPVGESRLMKLCPGETYRAHADADDRLHITISGNEYSFLVDLSANKMYQTVPDGRLYYMDASKLHVAANFGTTDRIQLVTRILMQRNLDPTYIAVTLTIINGPHNTRYLVDRYISPVFNTFIKTGEIGLFDPVSDSCVNLILSENVLNSITKKLESIGLRYTLD